MKYLFEIQPEYCRQKVCPTQDTSNLLPYQKRVVEFDPSSVYRLIDENGLMNPFKRQHTVSIRDIFPQKSDGLCGCGCGAVLKSPRKRWATDDCQKFTFAVFSIISGYSQTIGFYIRKVYGNKCECGEHGEELDHIHPVKFGGGGGWLSNYKYRCIKCHRAKTNADFGFKSRRAKIEQPTLF